MRKIILVFIGILLVFGISYTAPIILTTDAELKRQVTVTAINKSDILTRVIKDPVTAKDVSDLRDVMIKIIKSM